jgi:uncharacterized protein YfaP (DUF2135 family)/plastocyanin
MKNMKKQAFPPHAVRWSFVLLVGLLLIFLLAHGRLNAQAMPAVPDLSAEIVGQYGGSLDAVAVAGGYAYVGIGPRLAVVDISNPALPTQLSQTEVLGGFVKSVTIVGNYAYVAADSAGLYIIDISNPASPFVTGFRDTPGTAYGVAVAEDYAYVADGGYGLRIIDISNPSIPVESGSLNTPGVSFDLAVAGSYVYLADYNYGLRVIDVSSPAVPVETGFVDTVGYAYDVALAGDYAYVADGGFLRVIHIANPAAPLEISSWDAPGYARGVAVSGSLAYVTDIHTGLFIIDISNPASPLQKGTFPTLWIAGGITISGNYAYMASGHYGIQVISIANPAAPSSTGYLNIAGNAHHAFVSGDYAFITFEDDLKVLNVANPAEPSEIGSVSAVGTAYGVTISGSLAYVAHSYSGLQIVDISNPANPRSIGALDTPGTAYNVAVSGSYAYVADYDYGLHVINISNPASPSYAASLDTPGYAWEVVISGNLAYVADGAGGLRVIDISNPLAPFEIAFVDTPGSAMGVALAGNYAYVADWDYGLRVIDITNPYTPFEVGFTDFPYWAYQVAISGNYAYVANGYSGLRVINISNPALPVTHQVMETSGQAYDVFLSGEYAYLADVEGGIVIAHVSEPASTSFPFYDGFETGALGAGWSTYTTGAGRVQVSSAYPGSGAYGLLLDSSVSSSNVFAASILTIDLTGQNDISLEFLWRDFSDEDNPEDGVFISADYGISWTRIYSFNAGPASYTKTVIDLDAAALENGVALNDHFQIKFQFYDNSPIPSDGYGIDEVQVRVPPPPPPVREPLQISIQDHGPDPFCAVAFVDQAVVWTNNGQMIHSITEGEPVFRISLPLITRSGTGTQSTSQSDAEAYIPLFDSGTILAQGQYTTTFDTPGTYVYYSRYSPGRVTGTIQVVAPGEFQQEIVPADTGGTIELASGARLEIGADQLEADAVTSITEIPVELITAEIGSQIGPAYDFDGSELNEVISGKVRLTLPYDPAWLPNGTDPTQLAIGYFNGMEWINLGGIVNTVDHTLVIETDHLSSYSIFKPCVPTITLTREQTEAYNRAQDFIGKLYISQDVLEAIQTSDGQAVIQLVNSGKGARWLSTKSLCEISNITAQEIADNLGIVGTAQQVIDSMVSMGEALISTGEDTVAAEKIVTTLTQIPGTIKLGLNIVRSPLSLLNPAGLKLRLLMETLRIIGLLHIDLGLTGEIRETEVEIQSWLQNSQAVGVSSLTSFSEQTDLWADVTFWYPSVDYGKSFYRYLVWGNNSNDPQWTQGYANLFKGINPETGTEMVHYVLGNQGTWPLEYTEFPLFRPDRTDQFLVLLEYTDINQAKRAAIMQFGNFKLHAVIPLYRMTLAGMVALPDAAPGTEVKVKYIFIEDGHLDKRYGEDAPGYFYPITYTRNQLCYGACNATLASLTGLVSNATSGAPIKGATVCQQGTTNCDTTEADGIYNLSGFTPGYYYIEASAPGYSSLVQLTPINADQVNTKNFNLSPSLAVGQMRIVLSWGSLPDDLDAHLWLPPDQVSHVYYGNPGSCSTFPYACLDVDDTSSYGPETITIEQRYDGIYVIGVNNFSGSPSLTESGARVQIYDSAGLVREFTVPTTGAGGWWYVCNLDGATGAITPKNYLTDLVPGPYW